MSKKKPSIMEQRRALQRKHIPSKGLSKQTTRRLYKYYIEKRNPASDPRALAYGEQKRFEQKMEHDGKRGITIGTGKKIHLKTYIKYKDRRTRKQVKRLLQSNISNMRFSHHFKSGKREDRFRYIFEPRGRLVVNALNVNSVLGHLQKNIIPDLMETIDMLYKKRGYFYKNRTIGALIIYKTKNMPDDPVPAPVAFTRQEAFPDYLYDMLEQRLVRDILRHYKDAIITLQYMDIFIRSTSTPTPVEKLL